MTEASSYQVLPISPDFINETKALLASAYQQDPAFRLLLEEHLPDFKQKVRAVIREATQYYFQHQLAEGYGLFSDGRMIGCVFVGLVAETPNETEDWLLRLKMLASMGLVSMMRFSDYRSHLLNVMPQEPHHWIPLMGIHPHYQGQGHGQKLLEYIHGLCQASSASQGVVLDTADTRLQTSYRAMGYTTIATIDSFGFDEHILYWQKGH